MKIISYKATFVLLTLGSFLLISCNRDRNNLEIINVDLSSKNNQFFDINVLSSIHLMTTDSSIFGQISKLLYGPGGYYVFDRLIGKSLYLFDEKGEFIRKVINGKGPGEVLQPFDFIIDKEKNNIMLYDQYESKILVFDTSLNLIGKSNNSEIWIKNFDLIANGNYIVFTQSKIGKTLHDYILCDNDFKLKRKLFTLKNEYMLQYLMDSPISTFKRTLFLRPLDYNIYELQNSKVDIAYEVDFGKYSLRDSEIDKGPDYMNFLVQKGERVYTMDNILENDLFIVFSYFLNMDIHYCVYSKKSKRAYNLNAFLFNKKLPQCRIVGKYSDNAFICAVESDDIINCKSQDPRIIELFKVISPNDNESLIIMEFKENN